MGFPRGILPGDEKKRKAGLHNVLSDSSLTVSKGRYFIRDSNRESWVKKVGIHSSAENVILVSTKGKDSV